VFIKRKLVRKVPSSSGYLMAEMFSKLKLKIMGLWLLEKLTLVRLQSIIK